MSAKSPSKLELDEEALAPVLVGRRRREQGCYFTPAPLVRAILEQARAFLPPETESDGGRHLSVVDPSAGAGAFLAAAQRAFPNARLHALELDPTVASAFRQRVPLAQLVVGDALQGGFETLVSNLPTEGCELWVGNPPYNGTSALLRDTARYRALIRRVAKDIALPSGTSLRDDFVFFLLLCAARLREHQGVLALITPSSLLDSYLYAGIRQWLTATVEPCGVLDLGGAVFRDARVETCVTFWRTRDARVSASAVGVPYQRRLGAGGPLEPTLAFSPVQSLVPHAPDFLLRPPPADVVALDASWREDGEPLTTLVPVSLPGLKTRFDELLTDANPERLLERVRDFTESPAAALEDFARHAGVPLTKLPKLRLLHSQLPAGYRVDARCLRPYARYAGARHRNGIPAEDWAFCYLDRALIPRGDHRLRGGYDPHAHPTKLIFNVLERPLSALLLEHPGCVHDYRHARFAPAYVPARILEEGLDVTRGGGPLGTLVPNVSSRGRALCDAVGIEALFARIVRFIQSDEVQEQWAPVFGASRILPVPFNRLRS